jgi:cytochrome P450
MENKPNKSFSFMSLFKILIHQPTQMAKIIEENTDLMSISYRNKKIHFISNPACIKHIFLDDSAINYVRDPKLYARIKDFLGKYGSDETWQIDKKIMISLFNTPQTKIYLTTVVNESIKQLAILDSFADSGKPINIYKYLFEVTLNNVLKTFFGGAHIDVTEADSLIKKYAYFVLSPFVFPIYVKLFGKIPLPTRSYFQYQDAKKQSKAMAFNLIKQALLKQGSEDNIVKIIANGYGVDSFDQMDNELKERLFGRVIPLLVAGQTALLPVMVRLLVILSLFPMMADKLEEHIISVIGSRNPTADDLPNLNFVSSFVKETLRLYIPINLITRVCVQNDSFQEFKANKGDMIIVPVSVNQRLSKYWKNPEGFDPYRVMSPLTEEQKLLYMPFSLGRYACIGKSFAEMQLVILLTLIAKRYRLELTPGSSTESKAFRNLTMRVYKIKK